jgi:hypothetical protein
VGIYYLKTVERLDPSVRIFDQGWLCGTVNVFLAGVTVPSLLVRFGPNECERLTAVWATCLGFFLEHGGYTGFQETVLPEIANMTILHS